MGTTDQKIPAKTKTQYLRGKGQGGAVPSEKIPDCHSISAEVSDSADRNHSMARERDDAVLAGDLERALRELQTASPRADTKLRTAQMRYSLGVIMHRQGQHDAAVRQLELAITAQAETLGIAEVRFYLAASLEQLGQFDKARAEYDRFAATHPRSALAATAQRRAARLAGRAAPAG